jgi:myosin heavy subunit
MMAKTTSALGYVLGCLIQVFEDDTDASQAQSAMGMLGLSDQEQLDIFAVVSAILHLGNARFANKVQSPSSTEGKQLSCGIDLS